jgi:hypothetical protein
MTGGTLDQYVGIVRGIHVFRNSVARWQTRGESAHAAIWGDFGTFKSINFFYFTINDRRWQEVTNLFRPLQSETQIRCAIGDGRSRTEENVKKNVSWRK